MRKQGNKINNRLATMPLGMKHNKLELDARAALLAFERGVCTEQHIVDIYVLAELCESLNTARIEHIDNHVKSVKKLAEAIYNKTCDGLAGASMAASGGILLNWFEKQNNIKIARIAAARVEELSA